MGRVNPGWAPTYRLFRSTLATSGWVEGQNLELDLRLTHGSLEPLSALASELATLHVDVLVAQGSNAAVEAKRATTTIPIISFGTGDLVALRLVATDAQP